MKKIMFNDQYGLTQAVLDGRKTQTRRAVTKSLFYKYSGINGRFNPKDIIDHAPYKIGETVAIAQSYDVVDDILPYRMWSLETYRQIQNTHGWKNKMFSKAELMPHHIRITGIRLQQVGDITDEDALAEGAKLYKGVHYGKDSYGFDGFHDRFYPHPQYAYIGLIEKMGMRPSDWVFVYDFELVEKGESHE